MVWNLKHIASFVSFRKSLIDSSCAMKWLVDVSEVVDEQAEGVGLGCLLRHIGLLILLTLLL